MSDYRRRREYWSKGSMVGMTPNPIVLGRKFCSCCGRWRHVCDFGANPTNTSSGLQSYCRTCKRVRNREDQRKMTPKQRERYREYQRFWTHAQRRKAGIPERKFSHRKTVIDDGGGAHRLPIAPIVEEMNEFYRRQRGNGHPDFSWRDMAQLTGVEERTITRYRTGESAGIELDIADRIALALNVSLEVLYPYDGGR